MDTSTRARPSAHGYRQAGLSAGALPWVLAILASYVVFWVVGTLMIQYNLDRHGDMVENFAWGIAWQLGYSKHPPLFGWTTALWFSVFPRTDAAYYLLSAVNVAVAGFVMWLIARRFLSAWQQVIAVAMLFILPPLSFHAMTFNANSAMLPFWALAILFYLRTIEDRRLADAVLTGIFCGLAMLAKYHSAALVLALAAHAILDRGTRSILATRLPWAAAAAGTLVIAPHVWWMVGTDFRTITYAASQGDGTFSTALVGAFRFLGAGVLYALPGMILVALFWRRGDRLGKIIPNGWHVFADTETGRALLFAGLGTMLVTVAAALALSARLSSLWVIPSFITVPIFLAALVSPRRAERYWYGAPVVVAIFCIVLVAAAPWIRADTLREADSNTVQPISTLADTVQQRWHEATGTRLAIVAAAEHFLANGTSFYASDTPYAVQSSLEISPWVTPEDIEREGAVYICRDDATAEGCAVSARNLLGAVDESIPVSIPAVEGAGGPERWNYVLHLRYPAARRAAG